MIPWRQQHPHLFYPTPALPFAEHVPCKYVSIQVGRWLDCRCDLPESTFLSTWARRFQSHCMDGVPRVIGRRRQHCRVTCFKGSDIARHATKSCVLKAMQRSRTSGVACAACAVSAVRWWVASVAHVFAQVVASVRNLHHRVLHLVGHAPSVPQYGVVIATATMPSQPASVPLACMPNLLASIVGRIRRGRSATGSGVTMETASVVRSSAQAAWRGGVGSRSCAVLVGPTKVACASCVE